MGKIRILVMMVVVLAVANIAILVSIPNLAKANSTNSNIDIPKLTIDEMYIVEMSKQITCTDLEKLLGIPAGSVSMIENDTDNIRVIFKKNYTIDSVLVDVLAAKTGMVVKEVTTKR